MGFLIETGTGLRKLKCHELRETVQDLLKMCEWTDESQHKLRVKKYIEENYLKYRKRIQKLDYSSK